MTRFRTSGVNWEGRKWNLTPGGVALGEEIEAIWPDRHATDGTVASKGHDERNPSSDHRPRPFDASPAIVRALDAGETTEGDGEDLAERLRATRDERIKYVLHENRIFSSYSRPNREAWEWGPLDIGHESHVHISFTDLADNDPAPWGIGESVFTDHEIEELKKLVAGLDAVDSNGGFSEFAVKLIRRERETPLHDHDEAGDHDHDGRYLRDVEGKR